MLHFHSMFIIHYIRGGHTAVFMGRVPGFLYFLKYPGFVCLQCTDRALYDRYVKSRADGSSFELLSLYFGVIQQCFNSNERTNMHRFDRSL